LPRERTSTISLPRFATGPEAPRLSSLPPGIRERQVREWLGCRSL
jgi:hypothetical protein